MVAISARIGTFVRVKVSDVSKEAAISGSAAFFAPPIGITPSSGTPPRLQILSIASFTLPPRGRTLTSVQLAILPPSAVLVLESETALKTPTCLRYRGTSPLAGHGAFPGHALAPCAAAGFRAAPWRAALLGRRAHGA